MPAGEIAWDDAVHGRISFQGHDLDDLVILRTDGTPIYNLAVVSDDIAMAITHVIRGDDHISNTPKQVALYRALGAPEPVFAHVPMILGADGKKLSKRHGATAVGDYQDQGIFPAAMRNFLALLGWSPGGDREIMTEPEMIELFSLEGIQKKPAVFDTAKLEWMNGQYLSALEATTLLAPVERQLALLGVEHGDRDLLPLIEAVKTRSRTMLHVAEQVAVRLHGATARDEKGQKLVDKLGGAYARNLDLMRAALEPLADANWNADAILDRLKTRRRAARTQARRCDATDPRGPHRRHRERAGERAVGGGRSRGEPGAAAPLDFDVDRATAHSRTASPACPCPDVSSSMVSPPSGSVRHLPAARPSTRTRLPTVPHPMRRLLRASSPS